MSKKDSSLGGLSRGTSVGCQTLLGPEVVAYFVIVFLTPSCVQRQRGATLCVSHKSDKPNAGCGHCPQAPRGEEDEGEAQWLGDRIPRCAGLALLGTGRAATAGGQRNHRVLDARGSNKDSSS